MRVLWQVLLAPRFGVEQGVKPDGSVKIRAVDNFSWSHSQGRKKRKRCEVKSESVNGHFAMDEPIHHDHLDDLMEAMCCQFKATGQVLVHSRCSYVCCA